MQEKECLFGQVALNAGLIGPSRLSCALRIQAKQRRVAGAVGSSRNAPAVERLGEILKRRGWLDETGLERVLRIQQRLRQEAFMDTSVPPAGGAAFASAGGGGGQTEKRTNRPEISGRKASSEKNGTGGGSQGAGGGNGKDDSGRAAGNGPKRRRRLGEFELLGRLGHGAMSTVYLAYWKSKNIKVALKVLPPVLARDQEFLERFRREARVVMRLRHPNVVRAHHVGVTEGYHYIAMEYVPGNDLETLLEKRGKLTPAEVLKIGRNITCALSAAAAEGIVHRDIKPANIILTEDGTAKLADLGLVARNANDERVTQTGVAVGTPYYIAPEQATGESDVDVRADIYSFGATLYHLLIGEPPFPGDNPIVIMTQHIKEPLVPPHKRDSSVPRGLSRLIENMMAKDPADRYADPAELLTDIALVEQGATPGLKARSMVEREKESEKSRGAKKVRPRRTAPVSAGRIADAPVLDAEAATVEDGSVGVRLQAALVSAPLWQKLVLLAALAAAGALFGVILVHFLK